MSRRSRVLRRILLLALAVYLVCSVAAVQVMNAALFGRADEPDGLTVRYADVAADYPRQTVTFSSGSAQLTGWLYPAEDAAALVVIAHGLGADAEVYLPETMHFVDEGYSVLTYDATSNAVHQASKEPEQDREKFFAWLYDLEYRHMGLPVPDLVLYLDVPTELTGQMLRRREHDTHTHADIHEQNMDYLRRCRSTGLQAAKYYGWTVIACAKDGKMRSIDDIHNEIFLRVQECLKEN